MSFIVKKYEVDLYIDQDFFQKIKQVLEKWKEPNALQGK